MWTNPRSSVTLGTLLFDIPLPRNIEAIEEIVFWGDPFQVKRNHAMSPYSPGASKILRLF